MDDSGDFNANFLGPKENHIIANAERSTTNYCKFSTRLSEVWLNRKHLARFANSLKPGLGCLRFVAGYVIRNTHEVIFCFRGIEN